MKSESGFSLPMASQPLRKKLVIMLLVYFSPPRYGRVAFGMWISRIIFARVRKRLGFRTGVHCPQLRSSRVSLE